MIDLKPCPFCGGKAVVYVRKDSGLSIQCAVCRIGTTPESDSLCGMGVSLENAVTLWNRRKDVKNET